MVRCRRIARLWRDVVISGHAHVWWVVRIDKNCNGIWGFGLSDTSTTCERLYQCQWSPGFERTPISLGTRHVLHCFCTGIVTEGTELHHKNSYSTTHTNHSQKTTHAETQITKSSSIHMLNHFCQKLTLSSKFTLISIEHIEKRHFMKEQTFVCNGLQFKIMACEPLDGHINRDTSVFLSAGACVFLMLCWGGMLLWSTRPHIHALSWPRRKIISSFVAASVDQWQLVCGGAHWSDPNHSSMIK